MFIPKHCQLLLNFNADTGPGASPATFSVPAARKFLSALVEHIGMVRVTEPQAYYVTTPGNRGITASVNLATSHIAYHVFEEDNKVMLDVYSCKEFDMDTVVDFVEEHFDNVGNVTFMFLNRETFEDWD